MQTVSEEYDLPTLLGNSKQLQFWREVEREPTLAFAERKDSNLVSKWAVREPPSQVAKKKLRAAEEKCQEETVAKKSQEETVAKKRRRSRSAKKQMLSADKQKLHGTKPKTLNDSHTGRSSSSPANPELSAFTAEKDLMGAVHGRDLRKAKGLLCEHGPSLLGGLSSHAIFYATQPGNQKMCEILLAQDAGEVAKKGRDFKKEGLVRHVGKGGHETLPSFMKATFVLGAGNSVSTLQKPSCSPRDTHNKEDQSAPRRGRSASVPGISALVSCPKRAGSHTRTRRKSVY